MKRSQAVCNWTFVGVFMALALSVSAASRRDYVWFLRYVMDLDRLAYLEPGVVSRQFSSYNRASHFDRKTGKCAGMDTNGDAGYALAVHSGPDAAKEMRQFGIPATTPRFAFGDLEWVLDPVERNHVFFLPAKGVAKPKTRLPLPGKIVAVIPGPGCIFRIWSANPKGKISFYFDGRTEPMTFDFKALFLKGATEPKPEDIARRHEWPFIRPMVFRRAGNGDNLASDCYLPIPFAKSCIVTLTQPSFYHIGYKTFPAGTEVETFHLPLAAGEAAALDQVRNAFENRGTLPAAFLSGCEKVERTVDLSPGKTVSLARLTGPGIVKAFHAKLEGKERYAGSKVLLTARFDGEPEPCIWAPLVNFFGTGFEPHTYRSFPLGIVDGEGYCYFPMPFRKSSGFTIRNEGTRGATLHYAIFTKKVASLPPNTMHFKCKYRRAPVCSTFDYPFIDCTGQGRFVGVALCIDDAWRSWWGEGDEKIWVDNDRFPSFFGTGSEDFFGDAWGIRSLHQTFFACSLFDHNRDHARTCCYRWMVPDDVPFRTRLRATIENYPETIWGTRAIEWDEDYVSVAYWYQMPGGSDFFKPVPVAARRPWGKVPKPFVVEAETAFSSRLGQGARLVYDDDLDTEFSKGTAIDLGPQKAGNSLTFRGPNVLLSGPYRVTVYTPRELPTPARFDLLFGGDKIGTTPPEYGRSDSAQLGVLVIESDRPELTLRFTSSGSAVFDCFQFTPARALRHVVEAETATVAAAMGAKPEFPIGILWSGGRQLTFPASGAGNTLELAVTIPPGRWRLCAGLTQGPDYGDYGVFVKGRSGGRFHGFAPKIRVRDWVPIGEISGGNGKAKVRFVCMGKSQKSTGFVLGIDYIGWQRIVVEGAIEGETAPVTDVRFGRITDQKLGTRFSGGNHLWFHPTKVGASFVWPLDVQKAGRYELCVYFTKSWDYAKVRLTLDGSKDLGTFDTYAPTVVWAGKKSLGKFDLDAGAHQLKFEVVGKNARSKGILVGVDCLTLDPRE